MNALRHICGAGAGLGKPYLDFLISYDISIHRFQVF
jgi:hypothetical protein